MRDRDGGRGRWKEERREQKKMALVLFDRGSARRMRFSRREERGGIIYAI